MENENVYTPFFRKRAFLVFVVICSSFLVYYSVLSMISPGRKLAEIKAQFSPDTSGLKAGDEKIYSDSAYVKLLKDRAFLQARIIMAETDSIYLTIDLADSSMNLEISGVVVHEARISSFKASRILMKGNENIIASMLSTPFTISSDYATIRKEPVMIKMAPRDTSEYKPDIMPDTSITEPVNYILEMTNGARIYVYQEEDETGADRVALFKFDLTDRLRQTWKAMKRIAVFKVPEYNPYVRIKLPRSDAKIIYRAIPKNGQISLFL